MNDEPEIIDIRKKIEERISAVQGSAETAVSEPEQVEQADARADDEQATAEAAEQRLLSMKLATLVQAAVRIANALLAELGGAAVATRACEQGFPRRIYETALADALAEAARRATASQGTLDTLKCLQGLYEGVYGTAGVAAVTEDNEYLQHIWRTHITRCAFQLVKLEVVSRRLKAAASGHGADIEDKVQQLLGELPARFAGMAEHLTKSTDEVLGLDEAAYAMACLEAKLMGMNPDVNDTRLAELTAKVTAAFDGQVDSQFKSLEESE